MIVGVLLSYGWWGYELTSRYGNPILPYMNQIFHSPYAPLSPNNGTTLNIVDLLFYPIVWIFHPVRVAGESFLELSLPMAQVLLIVLLTITLGQTVVRRRPTNMFDSDKQRYLILVAVVSYAFWTLVFSQYRFLIPLEMLSFTLILVCLQAIGAKLGWNQSSVLG